MSRTTRSRTHLTTVCAGRERSVQAACAATIPRSVDDCPAPPASRYHQCDAEPHRAGHSLLLPPHGRGALLRPAPGAEALPIHRRHRRSVVRDDAADPARVLSGRVGVGIYLALQIPLRRFCKRQRLALGDRLLRGRLRLLLVAPALARSERALGRAHSPPPERGLHPRGSAAAGCPPGVYHL